MQSNKTIIITAAILILTILTAGCTDTGGANPETVKYTPPSQEEVAVVEETAAAEPIPVETPIADPVVEPVETPWYESMNNAEVGTYSTMFGDDVYAVKNVVLDGSSYSLFDIQTEQHILTHQDYTPSNLRLDLELSSDQYRALTDQYGSMKSATMETIDRDGAMDRVAIHYVGTGGEWDFKDDYHSDAGIVNYLSANIMK